MEVFNPSPALFNQMVHLSPMMRILCVGHVDFRNPAEIMTKEVAGVAETFISKCSLAFEQGCKINKPIFQLLYIPNYFLTNIRFRLFRSDRYTNVSLLGGMDRCYE